MLKLRIYTRSFTKAPDYFDICRENSEKYLQYQEEEFQLSIESKRFCELEFYLNRLWPIATAFGVMCLEAFIYDYAAHNFTDTFSKKYLDKLDLLSKWIIIPRLVLKKEFPTDSKAFQDLNALIKERNSLVHSKSKPFFDFEKLSECLDKFRKGQAEKKESDFLNAWRKEVNKQIGNPKAKYELPPFKSVVEIFREIRKLEGDDVSTQWWQLEEVEKEIWEEWGQ
jgi:hypothetical protein